MNPFNLSRCQPSSYEARLIYDHGDSDNNSTAFELSENIGFRILLPRSLGVVSVYLELFDSDMNLTDRMTEGEYYGLSDGFDEYSFSFDKGLSVGLYFFRFRVVLADSVLYALKSLNGVILSDACYGECFQLSVSDFKYLAPSEKYGGIIYHIFVDRFFSSRTNRVKDGAILVKDWKNGIPEFPEYNGAPLKNNTFYGGDLKGIIEKLDYIASLGVNTVYLSPIFSSPSNHKYDTADYMTVDSMFGDEDDLKLLIKEAGERGIGVILDGVFNHTGADSVYFNRYGTYESLGAYQSRKSPYYSWYDFKSFPDDYTSWWGIEILPRINPDEQSCRNYFLGKGGVIHKYSTLGIEGFRLDVVDELSDDFVSGIKSVLNANNPKSVLYGEVWEDGSNKIAYSTRKRYYLGTELDGVMNYPIKDGIIDFLTGKGTDKLKYALTDVINNAPARIRNMQMNLLGSHDTMRILTALGGESPDGRSNRYLRDCRMSDIERGRAKRLLRCAYTILATLPGIPSIYYGDEVGLEGYSDPFNRLPYPWGNEDVALLGFYRNVGAFRRGEDAYKQGELRLLALERELLVFSRQGDGYSMITLINNSRRPLSVVFDEEVEAFDPYTAKSICATVLAIDELKPLIIKAKEGISFSIL